MDIKKFLADHFKAEIDWAKRLFGGEWGYIHRKQQWLIIEKIERLKSYIKQLEVPE